MISREDDDPVIYNILFEADKHWGATRPEDQYRSSYILKRILAELRVHLFVSLGDFYDTKLLLNSRASVYAIRDMHDKAEICRMKGIPMRVIRGTLSHDYDQLEAFSSLTSDPKYTTKIFSNFTIEETLPGLKIAYCPDETINWNQWSDLYMEYLIGERPNIMCAHGNFDVVMAKIALDGFRGDDSTTLVYDYNQIMGHLDGPIISGHFHDGNTFEHLYYVGSADRWIFGEDHQKGYMLVQYDTDKQLYKVIRIPNFMAATYRTYTIYTHLCKEIGAYQEIIDDIEKIVDADPNVRVKIKVKVNHLYPDTESQILNLKYHFASHKRVNVVVEYMEKTQKKEEEKKIIENLSTEFDFLRDSSKTIPEKVQIWIKRKRGIELPIQQIQEIIDPELQKMNVV